MRPAEKIIPRSEGLGASDAAVALGLSPWKTAFELWSEKTGHASAFEETLPVQVGRALEPVILGLFMQKRPGLIVSDAQRQYVDEANAWRWATVDGIVSDGSLLEAKAISWTHGEWGEPGTDQVPLPYLVQCQHGLACTGLKQAYVPVLFEAKRFEIYLVPRDDEIIAAITAQERAFWQRVLDNDPPPLVSTADCALRYGTSSETTVIADEATLALVTRCRAEKEALAAAETQHDATKAAIMAFMGESAVLVGADGKPLATWRSAKGRTFIDADAVHRDHGDKYDKFGKPSRRFLVK